MDNALTIRLPKHLFDRLRQRARLTGLSMSEIVRQSLEATLSEDQDKQRVWMKFAGAIKDGPPDLSSRKGFSRG